MSARTTNVKCDFVFGHRSQEQNPTRFGEELSGGCSAGGLATGEGTCGSSSRTLGQDRSASEDGRERNLNIL